MKRRDFLKKLAILPAIAVAPDVVGRVIPDALYSERKTGFVDVSEYEGKIYPGEIGNIEGYSVDMASNNQPVVEVVQPYSIYPDRLLSGVTPNKKDLAPDRKTRH